MTTEHKHLSATIRADTNKALEEFITVRKGKKKFKISRSEVVDAALRQYLRLLPVKEEEEE